jgi:hypothetical protein
MFRIVRLSTGATLFMFSQVSQQLFVHIFFPLEKNIHLFRYTPNERLPAGIILYC